MERVVAMMTSVRESVLRYQFLTGDGARGGEWRLVNMIPDAFWIQTRWVAEGEGDEHY